MININKKPHFSYPITERILIPKTAKRKDLEEQLFDIFNTNISASTNKTTQKDENYCAAQPNSHDDLKHAINLVDGLTWQISHKQFFLTGETKNSCHLILKTYNEACSFFQAQRTIVENESDNRNLQSQYVSFNRKNGSGYLASSFFESTTNATSTSRDLQHVHLLAAELISGRDIISVLFSDTPVATSTYKNLLSKQQNAKNTAAKNDVRYNETCESQQ